MHQAADQLGYVRNRSAARLRGASTDIIGMVINDLGNPFFAEMAVGIERACRRADVTPFIANVTEDVERQRSAMRSMVERGVAGLIISAAHGTTADDLSTVMGWGVPVILVMREIPGAGLPTVVQQYKAG
ncbi:MAG: substrate-binding domain-containing protein, partial [Gammaproteobacteria bacterium]|nr:substrate-binding domain-containing protein [Gammaproteobacteria bacterium]